MSIKDKISKKKNKKPSSNIVTQKNIEESREEVLTNGKKFRYPFQYAKHRLVINAIIIGVAAVVFGGLFFYIQLYQLQSTSDVTFRFAKVLGLPVAEIDGVSVKYSDYLMIYRSSVKAIEHQRGEFDDSDDSKRVLAQYRRDALDEAEEYTYALAKLEEFGMTVTEEEIDAVIEEHRTIDGEKRSDTAFEGIISDNFGLNMKEYRHLLKLSIAKKNVVERMDRKATDMAEKIKANLAETNNDFAETAEKYSDSGIVSFEEVKGVTASNIDGGRAAAAASLKNIGDVSDMFVSKSGDGLYIVKLTAKSDGGVISYESIQIRFTMFADEIAKIREEGKVREMIKVEGIIEEDEEGNSEPADEKEPQAEE